MSHLIHEGKADLLSQTRLDLQEKLGCGPGQAATVFRRLYREGETHLASLGGRDIRRPLEEGFYCRPLTIERRLADEGAIKYLLRLEDGLAVESVIMAHRWGLSLCLSTQVGCAMGCLFCASGARGKLRDLTAGEMTGQILAIRQDLGRPPERVAIMGMGEPCDNYEQVTACLRIISDRAGLALGPRHISLSTCGLPDKIRALAEEEIQPNLCLSLHAPNDALRGYLMPIAGCYPLAEVMAACRYYTQRARRRVVLEYALLQDINDSPDRAWELAALARELDCSVNLIPYNPAGGEFSPSPPQQAREFYRLLRQAGLRVTLRKKLGGSIKAACGQLGAEANLPQ